MSIDELGTLMTSPYIDVMKEHPIGAELWKYWIPWQQQIHCVSETSNLHMHSKDFVDADDMRAWC